MFGASGKHMHTHKMQYTHLYLLKKVRQNRFSDSPNPRTTIDHSFVPDLVQFLDDLNNHLRMLCIDLIKVSESPQNPIHTCLLILQQQKSQRLERYTIVFFLLKQ